MKQQISGPIGIVIVVIVVALVVFFGYNRVVKGAGTITPEDMRANMMKGMEQQKNQGQRRGPGPGMMPGGPASTGGAPAGNPPSGSP